MNKSQNSSVSIFSVPVQPRRRTSDVIHDLAEQHKDADVVTLRELTKHLGDRTFGMYLVLVAVFNVIPLVSMVAGLVSVAIGLQMALGVAKVWLPKSILDYPLKASSVRAALLLIERKIKTMERFIRPRWQFSEAPVVDRINGMVVVALGGVIVIPLPLANLGPALIILLMGLGLMERDGMLQVGAATIGAIAVVMILHFAIG
ncbi:exopolysaccharide biosynthesis protein [Bacterioplanes sanyensis]|uniref:exopolysaccharide biosynthesis protein n=1 Tax=Bacterioplanes sanyensis TaxID=1249553 RepID=UPI0018EE47EC|nr:exopolysaccharide biosynthesis protein [Bacterioplanes sanyensis]